MIWDGVMNDKKFRKDGAEWSRQFPSFIYKYGVTLEMGAVGTLSELLQ